MQKGKEFLKYENRFKNMKGMKILWKMKKNVKKIILQSIFNWQTNETKYKSTKKDDGEAKDFYSFEYFFDICTTFSNFNKILGSFVRPIWLLLFLITLFLEYKRQ